MATMGRRALRALRVLRVNKGLPVNKDLLARI